MRWLLIALVLAMACMRAASAALITVEFSGHLIDTAKYRFPVAALSVGSALVPGAAFAGRYIYSDDLAGFAPLFTVGVRVFNGLQEISVTVGGKSYASAFGNIEVGNDTNLGTFDSIFVHEGIFNGPPSDMLGPLLNGYKMHDLTVAFQDFTATALNSTDLPSGAPDLSRFSESLAVFSFFNEQLGRGVSAYGQIEAILATAVQVSAPTSALVVGPALLLGLGLRRRA